jgi:tetratricopeptide (TPR) repeat protein
MLLPLRLSVLPFAADIPVVPGLCAAALAAVALGLSPGKRVPRVWFGLFWMICFFLPPLLLNREGFYHEHRAYVPFLGLFIVLGEVRIPRLAAPRARRAAGLGIAALLVLAGVASFRHCAVFRDSAAFWTNAAATSPHSVTVRNNLGVTYLQARQYERALRSFREALALQPAEAQTHYNIAYTLALLGREKEAMAEYRQTLRFDPGHVDARCNLIVLERRGKPARQ